MEYHCQLSPDHKYVVISNEHLPINMKHILEVKTLTGDYGKCKGIVCLMCKVKVVTRESKFGQP